MPDTKPLPLIPEIVTGNTKAAASQAGATSADLWMTPYDQIHYDPADNIRPVDHAWVDELKAMMMAHGYDKGSPLHCYVRKVDGKDQFFVYKGQHRYLAAGEAIKAGKDLGKIPLVVRDSRDVDRAKMVIDGYQSNQQKGASPLDLAAAIAELRDIHQYDTKTICTQLGITDQTVRDIALLEQAPEALRDLVREGAVAGTLAISEIRAHGGDKALERIVAGLSKAKDSGKNKVTKKHLGSKPASRTSTPEATTKIDGARAKRLLQALQSVLHDPIFGQLSPGTIHGVHAALTGLEDLLDLPEKPSASALATCNEHGVYTPTETLQMPPSKATGRSPAEIRLAQIAPGDWEFGFSYSLGTAGGSSPCTRASCESPGVYRTRVEAIRAAVGVLTRQLESSSASKTPEMARVRKWLDKLYAMPDPDWTPELAAKSAIEKEAS